MSKKSYDMDACQSVKQLTELSWYDYVKDFTQELVAKYSTCGRVQKIISITVITIVVLAALGGIGCGIYCE